MFLIEQLPAEGPEDVQAFLDSLVGEIYGGRPEWLDYELRGGYKFRGREFIQILCPAGSVHLRLSMHALSGNGISRDILQLGTRDGRSRAWLINQGQESEYDSGEIERVG
jgi:hypothetical protein